jgi:hypothetical protein
MGEYESMSELQARITQWTQDHTTALEALTEAETIHARAVYELTLARATAEQRIRDEAVNKGKRLTEAAIAAGVTLDASVQACEYDALDAHSQLIEAQNAVEAQRAIKTALAWEVALLAPARAA